MQCLPLGERLMTKSSFIRTLIVLFILVPSFSMAETILKSSENINNCTTENTLSFNDQTRMMTWNTETRCDGEVMQQDHTNFSENTFKTWLVMINKSYDLNSVNAVSGQRLHYWNNIEVHYRGDSIQLSDTTNGRMMDISLNGKNSARTLFKALQKHL